MSFNTNIRLTVLAAAFALAAAPSVFAQNAGTWQGGFHTDRSYGAPDDGARHSKEVMDKKVTPSGVATADTGTWQGDFHTDRSYGAPDCAATHSKEVMDKKVPPGGSFPPGYHEDWERLHRSAY